ncbi:DUF3857 and transglutaminase domain-containing protein [Gramella lutea]|uniref:DUF3857 and transglutaminase domain-containing protein n=1 Tax=Christiangramia lutea TaxID=1607951 RepID=A0A9X1V199_9FLAO|nr:DUF3857 domain-containing protein [Christiangramia lutea]MCH4821796.1 DUF3857 and transglutaminase domain-containing protein [Christiangramia lutea]
MHRSILFFSVLIFCLFQARGQNYKFGKVSEDEVLQKEHPIKKDANAALLYRDQKVYYDFDKQNGFTVVTEIHERVKIYSKEGFDRATKEISLYVGSSDEEEASRIKGYTYNIVDGKLEEEKLRNDEIFEEEKTKRRNITKFTMPAVKEGSVIEYSYTVKSPFTATIGRTPLQYDIPIDRLELEVQIPEFFTYSKYFNIKSLLDFNLEESQDSFTYNYITTTRSGSNVVTSKTTHNDIKYMLNTYKIERDDIPALKIEPHVDNLHNYAAFIDWELMFTKFPNSTVENYSETWEGVAKSIYNDLGIEKEIDRDNFYDDDLDQIIHGLSDPMMKARKIYAFVKSKVKWNDYFGFYPDNGTKEAYKEGSGNIGDINLLLVSMLKYANLEAHPVLLSTPSNGVPLFPTRDGFNYVIAGLELDGQVILMDASDPKAGIGELPKRARNWQGRIIKEQGRSGWVNLMPNYQSENFTRMNVKFDGTNAQGWNLKSYKGLFAKDFRAKRSNSETDYKVEDRLKRFTDFSISEHIIENENELGEEITEKFDFEINSAAEVIGDKVYLKPMLFEGLDENPFKQNERSYPVYLDYPELHNYSINILLPEGYQIVSIPESTHVKLGGDAGEFKFIVNGAGNVIRVSSTISLKKPFFLAEEYDFLKKFYANIIKKHSEAIVLEKTIDNGYSERAESGR